MPELPEVTTIINVLKKTTLIGSKIKSVDVLIPNLNNFLSAKSLLIFKELGNTSFIN